MERRVQISKSFLRHHVRLCLSATYLFRVLHRRFAVTRARVPSSSALVSTSDEAPVVRERVSKIALGRSFCTDLDGCEASWSRHCACACDGRICGLFDCLSVSESRGFDRRGSQDRASVRESILINVRYGVRGWVRLELTNRDLRGCDSDCGHRSDN